MEELGLVVPFWVGSLIWLAKTISLVVISSLLALLGVALMDILTPRIHERQRIGEDPIATGLFIGGFFILVGLVIHGAATSGTAVGDSILKYIFDFRVWGLLGLSFVISVLLGIGLFYTIDKLTPNIPFLRINENPVAVGIYVFSYLVFLGLILHAVLTF